MPGKKSKNWSNIQAATWTYYTRARENSSAYLNDNYILTSKSII